MPDLAFVFVEFEVAMLCTFQTCLSRVLCCFSVSPQMSRSSTITSTPSISSNISDMMSWKTSWADDSPKESLLNMYLPNGVLKVHSLALSSSNLICQNPELVSRTESTLELGIHVTTSSIVFKG